MSDDFRIECIVTKDVNVIFNNLYKDLNEYLKRNGMGNDTKINININEEGDDLLAASKLKTQKAIQNANTEFNGETGKDGQIAAKKYNITESKIIAESREISESMLKQLSKNTTPEQKLLLEIRKLFYGYLENESERIKALVLIELHAEKNARLISVGDKSTPPELKFNDIDKAFDEIRGFFIEGDIEKYSKNWYGMRFKTIFAKYWELCLELTGNPPSTAWEKIHKFDYNYIITELRSIKILYGKYVVNILECDKLVPWSTGYFTSYSRYAKNIRSEINEIVKSYTKPWELNKNVYLDNERNLPEVKEQENTKKGKSVETEDKEDAQTQTKEKLNTATNKGLPSTNNSSNNSNNNNYNNDEYTAHMENEEVNKTLMGDDYVAEHKTALMNEVNKDKNLNPDLVKLIVSQAKSKTGNFRFLGTDLNISNSKILKSYFKIPDDKIPELLNNELALAQYLYGSAKGNETPEDALKYKPRGYLGTTGKAAYAELDSLLGMDGLLLEYPDILITKPELAAAAAVAVAKLRVGADVKIDDKNFNEIMDKINDIKDDKMDYKEYNSASGTIMKSGDGSYSLMADPERQTKPVDNGSGNPNNPTGNDQSNNQPNDDPNDVTGEDTASDDDIENDGESDVLDELAVGSRTPSGPNSDYSKKLKLKTAENDTLPLFSYMNQTITAGGNRKYCVPCSGTLVSLFGWRDKGKGNPLTRTEIEQVTHDFHGGIDIAAPVGTKILAPYDGVVVKAARWNDPGQSNGGGTRCAIYVAEDNITYRCMHMSRLDVKYGDKIKRGQVIGLTGRSGVAENSYGPHLHLDFCWNNNAGAGKSSGTLIDPIYVYSLMPGEKLAKNKEFVLPVVGRRVREDVWRTIQNKTYGKKSLIENYVASVEGWDKGHTTQTMVASHNDDHNAGKPSNQTTSTNTPNSSSNKTATQPTSNQKQPVGGPSDADAIKDAISTSFDTKNIETLLGAVVQLLAENNKKLDLVMNKDNIVKMD